MVSRSLAIASFVSSLLLGCSSAPRHAFEGDDAAIPHAPGLSTPAARAAPPVAPEAAPVDAATDAAAVQDGQDAPPIAPPVTALDQADRETDAAQEAQAVPPPVPAASEGPWRVEEAVGAPDWLDIAVEFRARFEGLSEDIRAGRTGNVQLFVLRTLVAVTARFEPFRATAELIDSRPTFESNDEDLNASIVNQAEFLQLHFGYNTRDLWASGDELDLKLGRQTINLGSRRFISRNGFRNTINAFTGLRGQWLSEDDAAINAFVVVPVRRLPDELAEIDNDQIAFDEEQWGTRLWNLHGQKQLFDDQFTGEAWGFWLDENDRSDDRQTRNRNLVTLGARLYHFSDPGDYHFEWESAYQFGETRSTSNPTDTTDLDHQAQFHHLTLGYRFDSTWTPRLEGLFDYASGDKDPNDGNNERFDTLYGSRGFEWGRTGIFGPFQRSNVISPGARLWMFPTKKWRFEFMYRPVWLASKTDAWIPTGVRDPSGNSGRFVGELSQFAFLYNIAPKNVQFDFGLAYLAGGEFSRKAPNSAGPSSTSYVWFGMKFNF